MKHFLFLLLLGLALGHVQAGEDMTPSGPLAGSTLEITGPEKPIPTDETAWLRLSGLTLDEVKAAKQAKLFDLTTYPLKGVRVHASYDWLSDVLELMFESSEPGEHLVKIHLVRDGKLEIAAFVVTVEGDKPDPFPQPDPDPAPDPDPLPPLPTLQVTLLVEQDDRGSGTEGAKLANHVETVREYLSPLPCQYRIWDPDQEAGKEFLELLRLKSPPVSPPAVILTVPSTETGKPLLVDAVSFGSTGEETIAALKQLGVKQ